MISSFGINLRYHARVAEYREVVSYSKIVHPKEVSQNGATEPNSDSMGSFDGWVNAQSHALEWPYVGK